MQALLRGRPGREGGHCRSLFRFPQHCLGSRRPLGANKASPQPAAVQPPSAGPWGRAHQAPGLLKWQVQGGNEVMSKLGLGGRVWARAGQAGGQTDGLWGLCLHAGQPSTRPNSRGLNLWTESKSKAPRAQQRNQRKERKQRAQRRPGHLERPRTVAVLEETQPRSRTVPLICKPRGVLRVCACLSAHVLSVCMCTRRTCEHQVLRSYTHVRAYFVSTCVCGGAHVT